MITLKQSDGFIIVFLRGGDIISSCIVPRVDRFTTIPYALLGNCVDGPRGVWVFFGEGCSILLNENKRRIFMSDVGFYFLKKMYHFSGRVYPALSGCCCNRFILKSSDPIQIDTIKSIIESFSDAAHDILA